MAVEVATLIDDLVATNPPSSDPATQGDDHLRLIKDVLQNTFPRASRAFYFPTNVAVDNGDSPVTVATTDEGTSYQADASAGAVTLNLPAAATAGVGFRIAAKKTDSSANAVVLDGNSSELVEGATTLSLTKQYEAVVLECDGTGWFVVSSKTIDPTSNKRVAVVRAMSTGSNVATASGLENGDTLDGVTLATGDAVLLVDQSTGAQNGIYKVVASGAASRHPDYATWASLVGLLVVVDEGTARADTIWRSKATAGGTLDTTTPNFTQLLTTDEFTTEETVPQSGDFLFGVTAEGNRRKFNASKFPWMQLIHVQDQKTAGTSGGQYSSGAWRTRTLNTTVSNDITGASLASNQVTLPAGTYYVEAWADFHGSGGGAAKAKFYNATDAADVLIGSNASAVTGTEMYSFISGKFTIADTKAFELQFRTTATTSDNGGHAVNVGVVEVYAEMKIWRVS